MKIKMIVLVGSLMGFFGGCFAGSKEDIAKLSSEIDTWGKTLEAEYQKPIVAAVSFVDKALAAKDDDTMAANLKSLKNQIYLHENVKKDLRALVSE